jgi:hypothetical protein
VKIEKSKTDGKQTNTKLSVYFSDSSRKAAISSLDLYDLNPYNHMSLRYVSTDRMNNKTYDISSYEDYEKLFPVAYQQKYFKDNIVNPGQYKGLLSSSIALSNYEKPCKYIAIAYNLFAQPQNSDQIDGAISTIFVFDNKKNLVYKKENVLCVNNEIAVSDDGKYVAYRYGAAWADGILINDGVQIINTANDEVVFQDSGYVEGPSSGYYPNIIRFSCNYENDYVRDYYFNTNNHNLYSLFYNKSENQDNLVDIKPDGLLYSGKNGNEYFLFFEKDLHVMSIK